MKKVLLIIFLGVANLANAQDVSDVYSNILISEEIKQQEQANKAILDAKALASKRLQNLKIKSPALPKRAPKAPAKVASPYISPAPFGLVWGASSEAIKVLGVRLAPALEKDYVQSFDATYLPKAIQDFRKTVLTFGQEDELWRILSYGEFITDDKSASLVLAQYKKYYNMLSKKYGNAKEFYTPKIIQVEKIVDYKPQTIDVPQQIGNPDFLSQLESGEAVLYATFEDATVGAALSVNVDGNGQSYILLDYKNLKLFKQREEQTIDAL